MGTLLRDFHHGMRGLLKQPGFTAVAVITLGLGIAATTTIFSIINALILRPLSMVEPERVVAIWKTPLSNHIEGYVSYLDLQDWRGMNQSFTDIAGYKSQGVIMLEGGEAERLPGMRVTANFFPLMKVNPVRGRNFQVEEEKRGAAPVAIISYEFWQSRLGGDEAALGRQLSLDSKTHTVIGILPPGFEFPISYKGVAIWTTVTGENENLDERGAFVLRGVGRLKLGVTIEQAQADMVNVAANLAQEHPGSNRDTTIFLTSAPEQVVGKDIRRALWLLLGAVGVILLIACTNTANLLMVRASAKEKEIAIRSALGAGRWRIARHLMVESISLSLLAAVVGLLVTIWVLGAIRFYGANQLPRLDEVQIDGRVLMFAIGVSMLTALLFSLVPILKTSRPDINEVLKSGSKAATSSKSLNLWRDLFVVTEVALSLVLLVGAGLMVRSFAQLASVPPGFDPTNVLIGSITLIQTKYSNPPERLLYVNQTLARLKALPGVESAAFIAPMPFSGADVGGDFRIVGRPEPEPGREPGASVRSVSNEYFQALKIPVLKGRHFNEQDRREGTGAAIINQRFAQIFFPKEEPVGKRISNIGSNQNEGDPQQWEIVGIVKDVHHNSLTKSASPEIYLPYQQNSWRWGHFVVRTTDAPAAMMGSFREQIRGGDKTVPITNVRVLTQAISDTINKPRFYTLLFGLFAGIGLVLTMTGIYGVISYTVSQRTQEIGIRMALGATRQNVVRMVLMHGMALATLGVLIGAAICVGLARVMASLLFEVKPTDVRSFGIAIALLLASALFAAFVPARRATKVDPLVALRYE